MHWPEVGECHDGPRRPDGLRRSVHVPHVAAEVPIGVVVSVAVNDGVEDVTDGFHRDEPGVDWGSYRLIQNRQVKLNTQKTNGTFSCF